MWNTGFVVADRVLPDVPVRQWVLSTPFELRVLLAANARAFGALTRIFAEEVLALQRRRARSVGRARAEGGLLVFQHRFGGSLNLNTHLHAVVVDGVFTRPSPGASQAEFRQLPAPDRVELQDLAAFKNDVAYGPGLEGHTVGVFELIATAVRWAVTGNPPDVRDSDRIAREFLARVDQLVALQGGDELDAVLARAREEVLDGVPTGYRRRVLDRVLDLEEEALREAGAPSQELETLKAERDSRREHGWRALTGKGADRRR